MNFNIQYVIFCISVSVSVVVSLTRCIGRCYHYVIPHFLLNLSFVDAHSMFYSSVVGQFITKIEN